MRAYALPWLRRAASVAVVASALLAGAGAAAPVPELTGHVTDLTGTLPPDRVAALEQRLAALERRKGSQFLVLVVPTTQPQTIEQFSLEVAERTRIGREDADDGLLLLVARDDRKARIEVGYGLEGVVTDAIASRVIREYLAPRFRAGDYAGGLDEATAVLEKLVDGEPLPPPMAEQEPGDAGAPFLLPIFIGLFVGMFAGGTRVRPVALRRLGAGGVAAAGAFLLLGTVGALAIAGLVAFLLSGARAATGGRYIGHRGYGGGGFGAGGLGGGGFGGGGGGAGGGWSGGGGGFGGGGASGGW